jgi:outer membrane protein
MKKLVLVVSLGWLCCAPVYALDLLEAYELGLRNDPQVLQSEASRNAALQNKPISVSQLLPSLSFTGQVDEYHVLSFGQNYLYRQSGEQYFWQSSATFQLTQPVFHYDYWVRLWQSDSQIAQAEAQLTGDYQKLAIRVAQAYFNVLATGEDIEFTSVQLQSLESQLNQVNERLAVGFSTVVDLDSVQAEHDKVTADLILAQQKHDDATEALREIIGGEEPAGLTRVPDEIPLQKPEPADVNAWRDMALQNNLDIIAAMSAAEVAKRGIDLNFAGHLPSVDIVGQKSFSDTNRIGGLSADVENIGVTVRVPIFQGGGVNARVVQARHTYEQSMHAVDQKRRAAERQVKDAFRGVLSSIGRVGALKTALKSAESSLEATEMGYKVGTRTVVDIIIEQSKLFGTKKDYARARYDYLLNRLMLKQAAGTLTRVDIEFVNSLIRNARSGG